MNLLPYERLQIRTKLTSTEAYEKLHGVIEPRRFVGWFTANFKPLQGDIDDSHFEVVRVTQFRIPFQPIIRGQFQPRVDGCSINITMFPAGVIVAFAMVPLGIISYHLLGAIGSLIASTAQGRMKDPSLVLGLGVAFAILYVFCVGPFKFESTMAKEFLSGLFQAEEVKELGIGHPFEAAG